MSELVETSEVAFETLYLRLRQEGFRTGIDQQLRLQELLDHMHCEPRDLKTVLCPLFATNPTQQAIFYRVFDEVFPQLGAAAPAPAQLAAAQALKPAGLETGDAAQGEQFVARLKRVRWLLLAAVFVGGGLLYWLAHDPTPPPPPPPVTVTLPPETPVTVPAQQAPAPAPIPVNDTRTLDLRIPAEVPKIHPEAKRVAFEWSAIFTPLLMFSAFAAYRTLRRRMSEQRETKLQEPHFWPLQLEALGSRVFAKQDVRELARRMRLREDAAQSALDIPATISATIQGHGFPRFQYRAIRRPPEYLFVIERQSKVDHYAEMMTDLSHILQADGVLLSRYYFEGDPRRLFTEAGEQIHLEDLAARTQGFRLLLFGASGCLFHPVSGKLEAWAGPLFERYKMKAILLADAPRSKRVGRLEEIGFAVVPSDSAGLRQAVDFFESGGVPANKAFPLFRPLEEPLSEESLENPEGSVQQLWLAACAVYREINWNLTLRLASAVRPSLVCEAETSRMARMSWMRQGEIPPHWRDRLAESIPDSMRPPIQDSLAALLSTQAVPADTFAWNDWQHTLRAFRRPPSSRMERIRQMFSGATELLAQQSAGDMTCLRFLDRRPQGRFRIPERLRPYIFEQGLGVLGTRTLAWLPAALGALLLLAVVFRPWQIHGDDIRNVQGTVVDEGGQLYSNAKINGTSAPIDGFNVTVAGDVLAVTTERPYWPQEIRMAAGGKVWVVVGKKHPQKGPVKILAVETVRTGDNVQVQVDYTGPVNTAMAECADRKWNVEVKPAEDVALPPVPLDPRLTHECSATVKGTDGSTASRPFTVAAITPAPAPGADTITAAPEVKTPLNLLAFYKLDSNGSDSTGGSEAFTLSDAPFRDGALYLNGVYFSAAGNPAYRAVAKIPRLDYRSFTVALDFKAETFEATKPVILIGGTSARWWGLQWDGGVLALSLNNGDFRQQYPDARLTPGRWQNVICSFDLGQRVVRTVLDGRVLPAVGLPDNFELRVIGSPYAAADKELTFTNYSTGGAYQGYAANLRVYDRALSAAELLPLYASIAADSPGRRQPVRAAAPTGKGKPEILKFEADRTRVAPGDRVSLSWSVTGTDALKLSYGKVSVDPNSGTKRAETGSLVVQPTSTTTYTLGFADPSLGGIGRSVTVTVDQAPAATARSLPNQPGVTVTFTNATGQPVEAFWVDFEGKEKGYGAYAAGATWTQLTGAANIWRFRQNGKQIGEYTVPAVNPAYQGKPVNPQYVIRTAAPAGTYQLGPVGAEGGSDFQFPATNLQYIRIATGGQSIDSIAFQVPLAELEKSFGTLSKGDQDLKFDLGLGEEITGIGVSIKVLYTRNGSSRSSLVDGIKFYTNKRQSQWFGTNGGEGEQVLKIPAGGHFAGFVGRAGDSLYAIGLLYTGPPPASAK